MENPHRVLGLGVAIFVACCAFGAGTAAAGTANVSLNNAADGETTAHEWNVTVDSGANGTLETVALNYTETEANLSKSNFEFLRIEGNLTEIDLNSSSRSTGFANLTLNNSDQIDRITGNETIVLRVAGITNPGSSGTYDANMELRNTSSTFHSENRSFDVENGGHINGTVTNSTGAGLEGARVTVINATTNDFVNSTTTNASGYYSHYVPGDDYEVVVNKDGYTTGRNVTSVAAGGETTNNYTLNETGFINGTVTNTSGVAASNVDIGTRAQDGGTATDFTQSNATGFYSLEVPKGTYEVAILDDEYGFDVTTDVSVAGNATTTLDLTATELPGKGTINGTVLNPDGTRVGSGVQVEAGDTSYRFFNGTKTDGSGNFEMKLPEATYRMRAVTSDDRPPARIEDVTITEGETTDVTIQLTGVSYIEGQVTNASGSPVDGFVVADGDEGVYANRTNDTGHYNITAPPGEYTVSVFTKGANAESQTLNTSLGNTTTADFQTKKTEILHENVSITTSNGNENESDLELRTAVQQGLLQTQLVNGTSYGNESGEPDTGVGKPDDLEPMGVDDTTEFEINITVTNFSASSLLWALDDAEWETTDNATTDNATDITITGTPATLQANITQETPVGPMLFEDPANVKWPSGQTDRAEIGFNQTVYVGVFDLSTAPSQVKSNLNGISVTTNAQRFSTPRLVDGSLRVWIGAPGTTVDGEKHTGFYQATIPQSQLDEWGVDDPESELLTRYKGAGIDATVTDTSDGARIRLEGIGYSAGFVEVEPDTSSGGDGGDEESGDEEEDTGSATTSYSGSTSGSSDDTATPTATEIDVTPVEDTPTQTPTAAETPGDDADDETPSGETPAGTETESDLTTETATDDQAGFGAVVALLAVLGGALLAQRRAD